MVTSQDLCYIVLYHHLVDTKCLKWCIDIKMVKKRVCDCDSSNVIL